MTGCGPVETGVSGWCGPEAVLCPLLKGFLTAFGMTWRRLVWCRAVRGAPLEGFLLLSE